MVTVVVVYFLAGVLEAKYNKHLADKKREKQDALAR